MFERVMLFIAIFWCASILAQPHISASGEPDAPSGGGSDNIPQQNRIAFRGMLTAPACSLAMEDAYQTVNMGSTPVRDLQNVFAGPEKPFRLRLRHCGLTDTRNNPVNRIRVTFNGVRGETPERFAVVGQAQGIDLQITDSDGYPARQGQPMPPLFVRGNEEELKYTLQVLRNSRPLSAGDYYSVLQFRIDYE